MSQRPSSHSLDQIQFEDEEDYLHEDPLENSMNRPFMDSHMDVNHHLSYDQSSRLMQELKELEEMEDRIIVSHKTGRHHHCFGEEVLDKRGNEYHWVSLRFMQISQRAERDFLLWGL